MASASPEASENKPMDVAHQKVILAQLWELSSEDRDLEKALHMRDIFSNHPAFRKLCSTYKPDLLECPIDTEKIFHMVKASLKGKCDQIHHFLVPPTNEAGTENITVSISQIKEAVAQLEQESSKVNDSEILVLKENERFVKLFKQYHDLLIRYYRDYWISYRTTIDKKNVDLLCAKTQALTMKKRLEQTQQAFSKYGTGDAVDKVKHRRELLENENRRLESELKSEKERLRLYESLPTDDIREYLQLKEELNCRKWALSQLNQSGISDASFDWTSDSSTVPCNSM